MTEQTRTPDSPSAALPSEASRASAHAPWSCEALLSGVEWRSRAPDARHATARAAPRTLEPVAARSLWERLRASAGVPIAVAIVVLLLAAGVTVAVVAFSGGGAVAVTGEGGGGDLGSSGAHGEPATASSGAAPQSQEVFVHVVGAVAAPGVVALPVGSRVEEAVAKAGGASEAADLSGVNLARAVVDGEQLRVPTVGEAPQPAVAAPSVPGASAGGLANGSPVGALNLNAASEAELDALPGIGPALASRIVEWRAANGKFVSAEQLDEVSGIGPKLLERLLPLVAV